MTTDDNDNDLNAAFSEEDVRALGGEPDDGTNEQPGSDELREKSQPVQLADPAAVAGRLDGGDASTPASIPEAIAILRAAGISADFFRPLDPQPGG